MQEQFLISPENKSIPRFSRPLNIGILASGNGSNFEALVKASKNSILDADISLLIVSDPDCNAINRAHKLSIPCKCLNYKVFNTRQDYDMEIIKAFNNCNVEIVVMAGWMRIASSILVNNYKNRLINIHPSLLPSFKGVNAIKQALEAGVKITGCTVHIVRSEVDSGPVLIQAAVPILESDNKVTLQKKIQCQEHKILPIGVALAGKAWRDS